MGTRKRLNITDAKALNALGQKLKQDKQDRVWALLVGVRAMIQVVNPAIQAMLESAEATGLWTRDAVTLSNEIRIAQNSLHLAEQRVVKILESGK